MKRFALTLLAPILAAFLPLAQAARADDTHSFEQLRKMSQVELDSAYTELQAGPLPDGDSAGTAVFFPGSAINDVTQRLAALIWQGKVFDTANGILVNKVLGFRAVKAKVYYGESLLDGRQSIIIDYSKTSLLFSAVRDEIREVSPGLYLGRAYVRTLLGDRNVVNFILNFN